MTEFLPCKMGVDQFFIIVFQFFEASSHEIRCSFETIVSFVLLEANSQRDSFDFLLKQIFFVEEENDWWIDEELRVDDVSK